MAESPPSDASFDEFYFAHCCGRPYARDAAWFEFFDTVADRIVQDFRPVTVLDAGCAWGLLVEALRKRGIEGAGIDISPFAISRVESSVRPHCRVGSIAEPFGARYDLIVSMEVLEHMPAAEADRAIANMAEHTDCVLFSSSPFDRREPTHINVRPSEGWAEVFARHGLFRDVDYDAGYVMPWAVLYRRDTPTMHGLVRRYERWGFARDHAAREARAHAVDVQKQLAELERQFDRQAWLETKALELTNELRDRVLERDDAESERAVLLEQLGQAHTTIRAMESSIFWRLRAPWAALSRRLKRS